jgi:hypothetical protein
MPAPIRLHLSENTHPKNCSFSDGKSADFPPVFSRKTVRRTGPQIMDSIIDMRALLDGVEPLTLSLWMCALLLLLVLIGVRVAFAAAFVGIVGLCLYFMQRQGFDRGLVTALKLAGQVPHSKSSGYALSLIPTFIVIGYLAYYAGLTRALFEMAKRWVGWVPGGSASPPSSPPRASPPSRARRSRLPPSSHASPSRRC